MKNYLSLFSIFAGILFLVNCSTGLINSMFYTINNDAPHVWQIGFQDSSSQGLTGIIDLHNEAFFYLIFILLSVFWIIGGILYLFNDKIPHFILKKWTHGTLIELI